MNGSKLHYHDVLGTVEGLRRGITTGTCAAAAAKAAALSAARRFSAELAVECSIVHSDERPTAVIVTLPASGRAYGGREIEIPIEAVTHDGELFTAMVRKDAGDDDDITHNAIIGARVKIVDGTLSVTGGEADEMLFIAGGEGVGTVTKPGLRVPVGEKAINPTPKAMIRGELVPLLDELNKVRQKADAPRKTAPERRLGFEVEIFVPEGKRLAEKTWNPRLGIEGGISIIGTGGVVEPRSSKAFMATIAMVVKAASQRGTRALYLTPGYVGERYLLEKLRIPAEQVVTVGDHVGFAFKQCAHRGFKEIVFAGHIGKTAKIAAGLFNTHSKFGDARLETIAACAASCGASRSLVQTLLELRLAEEAVPLLRKQKLTKAFDVLAGRAESRLKEHVKKNDSGEKVKVEGPSIECILLNLDAEVLNSVPQKVQLPVEEDEGEKAGKGEKLSE